jgi:glyoxylase-like metal-dependent hydrolase (beta-lactamase superfamily II)
MFSEEVTMNKETSSIPVYEIYALKSAGPLVSKVAMVLWMKGWDENISRYHYIWAIKAKEETIVVDTGCGITLAAQRNLNGYSNPVDLLKRIEADAGNIKKVIITHLHLDHVGGMEVFPQSFPNATFYVQKKEYDFWMKHPVAKRYPFAYVTDVIANRALAALEGTDRLVLVSGDQEIIPGIELLLVPGHTVGLQAVAVNTIKGTAILASDCAHVRDSFKEDIPSVFITDLISWMESYDKLRSKASSIDLIFPGHDAVMLHDYPKVAEDVTRLV